MASCPLPPATIVTLLIAVLLLDVFDLLLPRGDRIGLEGPLVAAAAAAMPSMLIMLLALVARAAGMVIRRETSIEDWAVGL